MLATMSEACREYAYNCGAPVTQQWILTDYDNWERNPRYAGPDLGHPEYDSPLGSCFATKKEAMAFAKEQAMFTKKLHKVTPYNSLFVVYFA